ncbi:MAG: cyclase family protein [Myxococcales bacterium]|nr:cyclase family protein [Myxococcales bacterium]
MKTPRTLMAAVVIAVAAYALSAQAESLRQDFVASKVIDLTHLMYDEMAFWPGGVPFTKIKLVDYDQGYLLHKFEMGENTGTHVDAPAHFIQGNLPIDQIALSDLVAPAVIINVQAEVADDPDYQLSADDVRDWEANHGQIPEGSLVILNTGWFERFAVPSDYINMDEDNVMHFPGYGVDSAELLVARDVAGIGIDTVQLHGGIGYTWEYDAQLYLKRAKWARPAFGDPDTHYDRVAKLGGW